MKTLSDTQILSVELPSDFICRFKMALTLKNEGRNAVLERANFTIYSICILK